MPSDAGFAGDHLVGFNVELPRPASAAIGDDIRPTLAGDAVRHCTHFSLTLSVSRRFCRWVAWNLGGADHVSTGADRRDFAFDPAYGLG